MASKSSWGRGLTGAVVVAGLAGGGYVAWRHFEADAHTTVTASAPPPVPVTVTNVGKGDFPNYLTGLGTVQPYDTITVSSRVDGQITKVDFRQGQTVEEGDILLQIDPRPYQAALDQATAKLNSDQATLKNAQQNLQRYKTLSQQDFVSRQQLDAQQATVDQLEAQINGDQAAIDNAQTQVS